MRLRLREFHSKKWLASLSRHLLRLLLRHLYRNLRHLLQPFKRLLLLLAPLPLPRRPLG